MAWPFRRKKTEDLPLEVQDYYQAEKRERVGIAWLLAAVTLVVTVVAATGIFFGGRWAYRKLANKDQLPTTAVQQQQTNNKPAQTTAPSTTTPPSTAPSTTPAPSTPAPSTPAPTVPRTPSTTTNNNSTATQVPNTGPGNILTVFIVTSLAGAFLHRTFQVIRTSR